MKKVYYTLGSIEIYNKDEFIKKFKLESNTPKYVYPHSTHLGSTQVSGDTIINYNLLENNKFKVDIDLVDLSYAEIASSLNTNLFFPDTYYGVILKNKLLLYHSPKVLFFGGYYQAICERSHNVFRVDIEHLDLNWIKKIKDTRLAKKMYPSSESHNGFLYILED